MEKLPVKPLLPDKKVLSVLISSEYPKISQRLSEILGVEIIEIPYNDKLSSDIATHADCRFLQVSRNCVIVDESIKSLIVNYLTIKDLNNEIKLIVSVKKVSSPYPGDVRLNATVAGNKIICNSKCIDDSLNNYVRLHSFELIHVNQGYAACSVVLINENALITDDESIYTTAVYNGFDCLLIRKGSVRLKGREYGFIGGTCGMIDKNLIVFTGKLDTHIDSNLIKDFFSKYNVDYIELTDGPLIDIGGIIPFLQS